VLVFLPCVVVKITITTCPILSYLGHTSNTLNLPVNKTNKKLIFCSGYGRLGNRLYRLCYAIAIAKEYGYKVLDYTFYHHGYSDYFESTLRSLFFCWPKSRKNYALLLKIPYIRQVLENAMRLRYKRSNKVNAEHEAFDLCGFIERHNYPNTVILDGLHFRSDSLIEKYECEIKSAFNVRSLIKVNAIKNLAVNIENYDYIIGLHVRHGDYKTWANGAYYIPLKDYCEHAQKVLKKKASSRSLVIIFSDEEQVVKSMAAEDIIPYNGTEIESLYIMSLCDVIIGPAISTFSGFAAFLGGAELHRLKQVKGTIKAMKVDPKSLNNEDPFK